jgi:hypothetical protein
MKTVVLLSKIGLLVEASLVPSTIAMSHEP